MRRALFIIILFQCFLFAQETGPKVLFNLKGDLTNPSFFNQSNFELENSLLFQIRTDSAVNIYMSNYSPENETFYMPFPVTNNNYMNINPVGFSTNDEKIIFFQTNYYGDWDIAYRIYSNGGWKDEVIIRDSSADDINPVPVKYDIYDEPSSILYQKNNTIYFLGLNDTLLENIPVLEGNDSLKYSSFSASFGYSVVNNKRHKFLLTAAIRTNNSNQKVLIEDHKDLDSSYSFTYVIDKGDLSNPRYQLLSYYLGLTFDKIKDTVKSVNYFNPWADIEPVEMFIFNDTLKGDFGNLNTEDFRELIIDKINISAHEYLYLPYAYKYEDKGNSYVGVYKGRKEDKDTLFYTKAGFTNPVIGMVGFDNNYHEIHYAVWEDSIDGNIKLMGYRTVTDLPMAVNKNPVLENFKLYQNYPNPFNPSTTISYTVPERLYVTLKVYDILGKQVATLVNEEKSAGTYHVEFTTHSLLPTTNHLLSSGIYFYRLQAGNYISVKKMILIK